MTIHHPPGTGSVLRIPVECLSHTSFVCTWAPRIPLSRCLSPSLLLPKSPAGCHPHPQGRQCISDGSHPPQHGSWLTLHYEPGSMKPLQRNLRCITNYTNTIPVAGYPDYISIPRISLRRKILPTRVTSTWADSVLCERRYWL